MTGANDKSSKRSTAENYCPTCEGVFPEGVAECPEDGTRLVRLAGETEDQLIGRRIDGRFTVKEQLGRGGMGTVYRGLQHSVGREVAIKVINPRLCRDRAAVKRFLREATLASRLTHANTVTVLDFGQTEEEGLYLIMELLSGRMLKEVMEERGALSIASAVRIARQVCEALEAAHSLDIIHRDLKPSNIIMVDERPGREAIKVLDFGLAKSLVEDESTTITHSDALIGTPAYLAPDFALGHTVDARADLYSLGVILYQMVSGSLPFDGGTLEVLLRQHAVDEPPPLESSVPGELRSIIVRLLEKDPDNRYASAAALREALLAWQPQAGPNAGPPAPRHAARGSSIELAPTMASSRTPTGTLTETPTGAAAVMAATPEERGGRTLWRWGLGVAALGTVAAIAFFLLLADGGRG